MAATSARHANRTARSALLPICAITARRPCRRRSSRHAPRPRPSRDRGRERRGGLVRRPRARQARNDILARLRLDVAGKLTAEFNFELAIPDRAGNLAAGTDEKTAAHRQGAFEPAMYLGGVDRGRALEKTALGNVDLAAVLQIRLDAALDDELVARVDLARQRDLAADDQLAHLGLIAPR